MSLTKLTDVSTRWVAVTTIRDEYATLAQRRIRRLEPRQWRVQPISRPLGGIYAHPEFGELRLLSSAESAAPTTDAKWKCAQWIASISQPGLPNTIRCAIEKTERRIRCVWSLT